MHSYEESSFLKHYEVCFFYIPQTVCPASVWEKCPHQSNSQRGDNIQIRPPVRQYCRPYWQNLSIVVPSALLWQSILALSRKRSAYKVWPFLAIQKHTNYACKHISSLIFDFLALFTLTTQQTRSKWCNRSMTNAANLTPTYARWCS